MLKIITLIVTEFPSIHQVCPYRDMKCLDGGRKTGVSNTLPTF